MGVFISIKAVGIEQMKARLKELGRKVPTTSKATVYRFAQSIITDAKQNFVPVDDGPLRSSGTVAPVEVNGNLVRVVMGFGDGPSSGYALAVHEHLSEFSPETWKVAESSGRGIRWNVQGTGPKYLEKPFFNATTGGKLESGLASDLDAEWRKS